MLVKLAYDELHHLWIHWTSFEHIGQIMNLTLHNCFSLIFDLFATEHDCFVNQIYLFLELLLLLSNQILHMKGPYFCDFL